MKFRAENLFQTNFYIPLQFNILMFRYSVYRGNLFQTNISTFTGI